jgi:hypothetical protein
MRARWDSLLKPGESFYVVDWISLFFEYLIHIDFTHVTTSLSFAIYFANIALELAGINIEN